jgi:hypothetical protein
MFFGRQCTLLTARGDPHDVLRLGIITGQHPRIANCTPGLRVKGYTMAQSFCGPLHAVLDWAWVTSQRSCDERTKPVYVPFYCSWRPFAAATLSHRPIAPFLRACNFIRARTLSLPGIQQVPGSPNAKICFAQRRPITRHCNYGPNPGELSTISGWSRSLKGATHPPSFISVRQSPSSQIRSLRTLLWAWQ